MRLIDADELLRRLKNDPLFPLVERYNVTGVVETQPTVDAVSREKYEASKEARHILVEFADDLLAELKERVEVVRCKDCERVKFDYYDEQYPCFCDKWLQCVKYNDYCSYGKRREE